MTLVRATRQRETGVQGYLIDRVNHEKLGKAIKIDGSVDGTPDVLIKFISNGALLVECKRDAKEKPKPHQVEQHKEWEDVGMPVIVVRTKREADTLILLYA